MSRNKELIYGIHPVEQVLLNDSREIYKIYALESVFMKFDSNIRRQYENRVRFVDKRYLNQILGDDAVHQGIIIETGPLKEYNIYHDLDLDLQKSCIVLLDQITDPHNIGAIIRSAACFNIDLVVATKDNMPSINSTIIKTSSGASELVPISIVTNLNEAILFLKKHNYWIVGLDSNSLEGDNLGKTIAKYEKIAFVFGSEGSGMRRLVRENCDLLLKIPTTNKIDSLNVSNAAAIVMYEYYNAIYS